MAGQSRRQNEVVMSGRSDITDGVKACELRFEFYLPLLFWRPYVTCFGLLQQEFSVFPLRKLRHFGLLLCFCFLLNPAVYCNADVKLPKCFSSHMVLQREMPINVWGWDAAGTQVTVSFGETTVKATADDEGSWMVTLPAMKAGGPFEMKVSGSSEVVLDDILMGDVWVCSGQSNMEWPVQASNDAKQEIANANHPNIRHIKVDRIPADSPQSDWKSGNWEVCSPQTAGSFTAVGYYFGRQLQAELNVPIGLVGTNWGGTRIEPWTPPVGFKSVAALASISDNLDNFPSKNENGAINHQTPLALYNSMIHPMIKMPIKGAIWYQGESNNGEGMLYRDKMEALISGWRKVWNQPEMPFYFVQLAPYRYGGDETRLAEIWEAQTAVLKMPNTGMAITVDIGNVKDIHPRNKQDVGKRLALWALKDYGKKELVYSGPIYEAAKTSGNKMEISFQFGAGLATSDGSAVSDLLIAGADKQFFNAMSKIEGDKLVVWNESVAAPVAVRYAFDGRSEPNLVGSTKLPASPFRTDSWKDAKVPLRAEAVLGTWTFKFATPDGNEVQHDLTVTLDGGKLQGMVSGQDGERAVDVIAITPAGFSADFSVPYQGGDVDLQYDCAVNDKQLTGTATFEVAGQTGNFPITAVKK